MVMPNSNLIILISPFYLLTTKIVALNTFKLQHQYNFLIDLADC